jgi:hypothetical protein
MELHEFIGRSLDQLQVLRDEYPEKRHYVIDELEFEIAVSQINQTNAGINFQIFNFRGNQNNSDCHKIRIKLISRGKENLPRRTRNV